MFISFEGVDGAGKSTLVRLLGAQLTARGINNITTRELGGTANAENIRSLLLQSKTLLPLTEAYLCCASRAEHCAEVVIPALVAGTWVLSDRFFASTFVYQHYEKGVPLDVLRQLHRPIENLFHSAGLNTAPNLEIIFDLDYYTSLGRLRTRQIVDPFDHMTESVFERRREGYRKYAELHPASTIVIDASRPMHAVLDTLVEHITTRTPSCQP